MEEIIKYTNKLSFKNKLSRLAWNSTWLIVSTLLPSSFGNSVKVCILKFFGAKIGKGTFVYSTARIWAPWNLILGDNVVLGDKVIVYNVGVVQIKSNVTVSQYAHLSTASHNISSKNHELITAPILIMENAWVAADAFINMGVTIGESAVVGARASVFKDVSPYTVVGGNPAVFINKRPKFE